MWGRCDSPSQSLLRRTKHCEKSCSCHADVAVSELYSSACPCRRFKVNDLFARVAMSGITDGRDGKKITACGLCLVKTGTPWGGKQPHDGGCQNAGSGLCPLLRNVCFHCLEKYHFKREDCKLKKVRHTAQNEKVNNWCCACLTKDDRRTLVTALHANGFGF